MVLKGIEISGFAESLDQPNTYNINITATPSMNATTFIAPLPRDRTLATASVACLPVPVYRALSSVLGTAYPLLGLILLGDCSRVQFFFA